MLFGTFLFKMVYFIGIDKVFLSSMTTPSASTDLILQEAAAERSSSMMEPAAVFEADAVAEAESSESLESQLFCVHSGGLPMTTLIGHMPVDTAAGHPTCGGAYFQAFVSGFNACGKRYKPLSWNAL